MLEIGTPSNLDDYISVDNNMVKELHKLGFQPIYRDLNGNTYFVKTKELELVVKNIIG